MTVWLDRAFEARLWRALSAWQEPELVLRLSDGRELLVREARLEDLVDVHYCDYRDIEGRYDKIVSIEVLEAVGREYRDEFFELQRSIRRVTRLELHDLEEIGSHYARTLRSWRERFWTSADAVRALGFDESSLRLRDFYLAGCEASFSTNWNRDLQLVLTRPVNPLLREARERR